MRIKKLSQHLANQIAAGEVVDRPASIIKELLENSIDAQATSIIIKLTNGGIEGITVIDDGIGIHPEDLPIAIESHTTSKLLIQEDLHHIATFGFRGEALSSIFAVSKCHIISKHQSQEIAWQINHLGETSPANFSKGSKISISELFYNIPARKHFLKQANTEFRHCLQVFNRLAIIHQQIEFQLWHNDRKVVHCLVNENQEKQRIKQLMGEQFAQNIIPFTSQNNQWQISGWLVSPNISSNTTDKQYCYINNRPIKDKLIASAIKRAYSDYLYHQRQPMYIVHLSVPLEEVDVNVHPNKHEVRLRDNSIFSFIQVTIESQLKKSINQQLNSNTPKTPTTYPFNNHTLKNTRTPSFREQWKNYSSSPATKNSRLDINTIRKLWDEEQTQQTNLPFNARQQQTEQNTLQEYPLGNAIAFIHGIFILSVNQQGLVIIDAHAAHERIIYEQLKTLYEDFSIDGNQLQTKENDKKITSQTYLIKQTLLLSLEDKPVVTELKGLLKTIGIDNEITDNEWEIKSCPTILQTFEVKTLLQDLIDEFKNQNHGQIIQQKVLEKLSSKACHQAVRANHQMSIQQMNELLRKLENSPAAQTCNHGRPTWQQLTLKELNAFFNRGH